MKSLILILSLIAQSPGDLLRALAYIQQQADETSDAIYPATGHAAAWIDNIQPTVPRNYVAVEGWAFDCDQPVSVDDLVIRVDRIPYFLIEDSYVEERPDVVAAFVSVCPVPLQNGFGLLVNLNRFPPGPHTVQVTIRNATHRATRSNGVTVIVSAGGD